MRIMKVFPNAAAIAAGLRYLAVTAPLQTVILQGQPRTIVGRGITINIGRRGAKANTWAIKQANKKTRVLIKRAIMEDYAMTAREARGLHSHPEQGQRQKAA